MSKFAELGILDELKPIIFSSSAVPYTEIRYQSRKFTEIVVVNGELERIRTVDASGYGLRVLVNGAWGFSSTSKSDNLQHALEGAISLANVLSQSKKKKIPGLAKSKMAKGRFYPEINGDLLNIELEQKLNVVKEAEAAARKHSRLVKTSSCTYREFVDHKVIVNSDGAEAEIYDSKPEFGISVVAKDSGDSATATDGVGITGGWKDLFGKKSNIEYSNEASEKAIKLLHAKHPLGEKTQIILDPGMVGLLAHEAIGHTVEADFVLSGSIVGDKVGKMVASEMVTLVDSGNSENVGHAGGSIMVDDEGVVSTRVPIIKDGVLCSFLHNRESALTFGLQSTGNARAFDYGDEPIIRMRNTFIEPGSDKLEEIVKETRHGYLVRGARNGQADANAEFMFGAQEACLIEGGEIKTTLRGASVSGNAFEVLKSIDMLGREFEYDMGSGYCGKYQPAKVDGGGPYLRCTAIIGGQPE